MNIERDVYEVIAGHASLPVSDISMEKLLVDDLGVDSLDVIELCLDLEIKYDIQILDEDWNRVRTVADIVQIISENLE